MKIHIIGLFMFLTCANGITYAQKHHRGRVNFDSFIVTIQKNPNGQNRYSSAIKYFSNRRITVSQLLEVCYFMPNDEAKYALCLSVYPHIIDKNNFFSVYDAFSKFSYAIKLYHATQSLDNSVSEDINTGYDHSSHQNNNYSTINFPDIYNYRGSVGVGCSVPMAEHDFNHLVNNLMLDGKDGQRLELLKQQVSTYCFSVAQIMKLGLELQLEKTRLNFLKFAFGKCFDMDNYMETLQIISHSYYKDDLKDYILSHQAPMHEPTRVAHRPIDNCFTTPEQFAQIKTAIKDQKFKDDQMKMAKMNIAKKCLSMEQLKSIVAMFSFDDDRLELIKYLYNYAPYPGEMGIFRDELTFLSNKQEFDKFILENY